MSFKLLTNKGIYKYKLRIICGGEKFLDKAIMKENVLLFDQITKRNHLPYGMTYGTLLGAIREHDFIEHDEDVDYFILSENRELFKSMLFELRENGFELARWDRRGGLCSIIRKGEYMDIYIYEPYAPGLRAILGVPIPEKFLTDVVPYEFQGIQIMGARDVEDFMYYLYGETWRTPIQTNVSFSHNWFQRLIHLLKWWLFFHMPDFIFYPLMNRRKEGKVEAHNARAARLNAFLGKNEIEILPVEKE